MTPFKFCSTAARTQFIPPRLFGLQGRDGLLWLAEIRLPRGVSHSRGLFVNGVVFFHSHCRYVDGERLRPVIDSIGTDLCYDSDDIRSLDGQRSCAAFVIHPARKSVV